MGFVALKVHVVLKEMGEMFCFAPLHCYSSWVLPNIFGVQMATGTTKMVFVLWVFVLGLCRCPFPGAGKYPLQNV